MCWGSPFIGGTIYRKVIVFTIHDLVSLELCQCHHNPDFHYPQYSHELSLQSISTSPQSLIWFLSINLWNHILYGNFAPGFLLIYFFKFTSKTNLYHSIFTAQQYSIMHMSHAVYRFACWTVSKFWLLFLNFWHQHYT